MARRRGRHQKGHRGRRRHGCGVGGSNAWVVRLAQLRKPGKMVWLTYTPPAGNTVVPLDGFVKPITEAEAYGAHWVIALDSFFAGQIANATRSPGQWQRMMAALRFAQSRRGQRPWEPVAPLTVASTFEGDDKLLSEEFLNLAPRRHLAYRALLASDIGARSFAGQKAVLYLENTPPRGAVLASLLEFAQAGGLLIAPFGTVDTTARRNARSIACAAPARGASPCRSTNGKTRSPLWTRSRAVEPSRRPGAGVERRRHGHILSVQPEGGPGDRTSGSVCFGPHLADYPQLSKT